MTFRHGTGEPAAADAGAEVSDEEVLEPTWRPRVLRPWYVDASGRAVSEGRRALAELAREHGEIELAIRCDFYRQRVSDYVTGRRRPTLDHAAVMEERLAIPATAWTYAPM